MDIRRERHDKANVATASLANNSQHVVAVAGTGTQDTGRTYYSQQTPFGGELNLSSSPVIHKATPGRNQSTPQSIPYAGNDQRSPLGSHEAQDNPLSWPHTQGQSNFVYAPRHDRSDVRNYSSPASAIMPHSSAKRPAAAMYQDSPFSASATPALTKNGNGSRDNASTSINPATPQSFESLAIDKTRTSRGRGEPSSVKANKPQTPKSVPRSGTLPSINKASQDSTPLSTVASSTGRSGRGSQRKRSRTEKVLTPLKTRAERFAERRVSKEQEYNSNNPGVAYSETKTSFNVTYIGKRPFECRTSVT